jgi:hypothetical protein
VRGDERLDRGIAEERRERILGRSWTVGEHQFLRASGAAGSNIRSVEDSTPVRYGAYLVDKWREIALRGGKAGR